MPSSHAVAAAETGAPPDATTPTSRPEQLVNFSSITANPFRTLGINVDASERDIDALVEAYRNAFINNRKDPGFKEPPYEGAVELLETLGNQNCLQAVATGKSHKGIEAIFGMHDLGRYFDTVWCADDGPGKPSPFMVEQSMKVLGCDPSQTVMVGDAIHDIHMGRAAKVVTHGVTWGFGERSELEAAGVHHLHETMPALHSALTEFAKV